MDTKKTKNVPRLALIQQQAGSDLARNQDRALMAVKHAAARGAEVVCFPELAFTPFYPQNRWQGDEDPLHLAEPVPGPTTEKFGALAADLGVTLVLNLYERRGDNAFDSSPIIGPDGTLLGVSSMVHITDFEHFHERSYYTASVEAPRVFEASGVKLGVVICYDRHYPESFRALAERGVELVLVPQAGAIDEWPPGVFEAEIQAAALQNGIFVALCNRVGKEEQLEFGGESFVCGPNGAVLARATKAREDILICDLDLDDIANSPAKRLFLRDRRPDLYRAWSNELRSKD